MALTGSAEGPLRWAVAERPRRGATCSGDAFVVVDRRQGPLVAVLDGLGHGREAAEAVCAAADAVRRHCDDPLTTILERCATAVRGTRGVVATLCSFEDASARVTWTAIGNVAGLLVDHNGDGRPRRREVVQLGGIVGPDMPPPHLATVEVRPGSLLVLATDGIDGDFSEAVDRRADPALLAGQILSGYGGDRDDALVLVGRYEPQSTAGSER